MASRRAPEPRAIPQKPPPPSKSSGDGSTRYTVLNAKILVESERLSSLEHDRAVNAMINRLKGSTSSPYARSFVAIVIYDEGYRHILGSDSGGIKTASSETGQIIGDLFDLQKAAS